MPATLAQQIDALLPQTQCTRCGFSGCRPYADAIAAREALTDRCPPGGTPVAAALAALLGVPFRPVDPAVGTERPPKVAVIDEAVCIGCAKCLPACPVDAIAGARKRLHTVIEADCSGCELCLPPCPVDCIRMVDVATEPLDSEQINARAVLYRDRYEAHLAREDRREAERRIKLAARSLRSEPQ